MRINRYDIKVDQYEAGVKIDQMARKFSLENNCTYPEALEIIVDDPDNAELLARYTNNKVLKQHYSQREDAGREIDRKAKVIMLKYNKTYREAFDYVIHDPDNDDLVKRYFPA